MAGRRKYNSGCAVAHALDLVGERWALLVVRDLVLGPKRFTDLLAGLPGASADVLTQRLRELTEAGVVDRRRLSPPAASWVYELTPWGAELAPVVVGLAQWASRSPTMRYDAPLGTDSLMLSLKALFDGPAAADLEATIAVHLGDERFQLHIADGELRVTRGELDEPDAVLETDQTTLMSLLRTDRPLDEVLASGNLRLAGDRGIVERVRRLFPLPQPIPIAGHT
jgi:DNA-binding HxlR family transcriptional regulator/putative sterol carrier protein